MNEDFIYKALPQVRKEFAQSLYARISADMPATSGRKLYLRFRGLRRSQVAAAILAVFLLVAWSQIRLLIRYIPIGDLWLVEFARTTQIAPSDQPAIVFVPTSLPTPFIYDGTTMPTPEVGGFQLYFPSWIPEGFSAIEVLPWGSTPYEQTIVIWSNDAQEKIRLFMVPRAGGMHPYAPPGTFEEVQVNGKPSILIHGRLTLTTSQNPQAQRKWDEALGLQLHWIIGKYVYALETFGPYVSEQELIRMAESMKILPPPWFTATP